MDGGASIDSTDSQPTGGELAEDRCNHSGLGHSDIIASAPSIETLGLTSDYLEVHG